MAEPYIGEIRLVAFNFAPYGFALCNGQIQSISENETLFALIGTTYGGNGTTTFALPDLQGRTPVHFGTQGAFGTTVIGEVTGTENVTILSNQLPAHTHVLSAQPAIGALGTPANNFMAGSADGQYANAGASQTAAILANVGQNIPHNNIQPFLALNYVIALFGIFPSRN